MILQHCSRASCVQIIESLREQVAALTKERDRWQQAYDRCNEVCKATEECWNADLAAMTKERDRWQEDSMRQAATINRMSAATEDRNEVDQLRHAEHDKELAAAQAQIAQLKTALQEIIDCPTWAIGSLDMQRYREMTK